MLKADHQRVKDLFAHYEATSNLDTKRTWAEQVFVERETHAQLEEEAHATRIVSGVTARRVRHVLAHLVHTLTIARCTTHTPRSTAMEQFTLDEAQRWIGRSVIAKTDWHAGSAQMAAEQQGTVIGVQGEHTLDGDPILCLVVQLWPEQPGDVPTVIFVPKAAFNAHLCLSHTVE
jgi:hypothetical protein